MFRRKQFGRRLAEVVAILGLLDRVTLRWTAAWGAVLILQGLLPLPLVHVTRVLVDRLVEALGAGFGSGTLEPVLLAGAGLALLLLGGELLQGAGEWTRANQSELAQEQLSARIQEKSLEVDLSFYESPDFHDSLDRARGDAVSRSTALLENLGSVLQNGVALAAMAAALLPYGFWLPLLLLATAAPAMAALVVSSREYHAWWDRRTPDRRRMSYYEYLLTSQYSAAEVRLFGLGPHFRAAWQELRGRLRRERLGLVKRQGLYRLGAGLLSLAAAGAAFGWVVWSASRGRVSLGDIALLYQVFGRTQAGLRALLGGAAQIYANSLFAETLFAFLSLAPRVVSPEAARPPLEPVRQGVRFEGVTFRYPGSGAAALEEFDLEIKAGQMAAIVGENGAGKSTLVKLLCRFYDPDQGVIRIDGTDVREFHLAALRRMVTVLFQLPVAYQATARDGVRWGDLPGREERAAAEENPGRLRGALRAALADRVVSRLPLGLETPLGRWFAGGVELSAGEWQRISMARTLYRRAEIVVLDEPTSFLDAWSEAEWFDAVREHCRGRTVILITHRLSMAQRADRIHVVHAGRVVESGAHDELLARGGRYAESWRRQQRPEWQEAAGGIGR